MAAISAFRGWRYDLAQVGPLSDITAPAVTIDDDARKELYERHPCNIVRVISNRPEPGDENESVRFERAADFLHHWQSAGVLELDHEDTLFVYHLEYGPPDDRSLCRGILCRADIRALNASASAAAQESSAAEQTLRATKTMIVPVVCVTDELVEIIEPLESAAHSLTPLQCNYDDGTVHRIWPITELAVLREAIELMHAAELSVVANVDQLAAVQSFHETGNDGHVENRGAECLTLIMDAPPPATAMPLAGIVLCEA